jgi:endoglucanase
VKVDQAGYLPKAPKVAIVTANTDSFVVKTVADGKTVFTGKLSAEVADKDSGDKIRVADFSTLTYPGDYYVEVPGAGRSYKFSIKPDVYARPYYMAMLGFYGQRCGTDVDLGPEFPEYKHPACHKDGRFHPTSGREGERPNIGGWHDAGDYGRYVVNSGITTGTILWTYEMFGPKVEKVALHIPEHGNGTPDILSEARWNIEWMLKMQDDDGGAWFKQTTERFSGFIDPDEDKATSLVIGSGVAPYKTTCGTADLSAVAAIAARLYKPFDASFADKNLKAAKLGFEWAVKNPHYYFKNPQGIQSGEYPDNDCGDEILWAAAELWRTTGEQSYNKYFVENNAKYRKDLKAPADNWSQEAPMAFFTYAMSKQKSADAATVAEVKKLIAANADQIVAQTNANPYRNSLKTADYIWGSTSIAANYSVHLLVANYIKPNPAYVEASLDNLHYILGRNPFALSYVTQVGENAMKHPHHRPSHDTSKLPWPGLLSGGPNANRQDVLTKALPPDTPPAKMFVDELGSYASNEIAINWQAVLVFTLAGNLP